MNEILDRLPEIDASAETVVVCHHGTRSAFVTQALDRYGFEAAYNLEAASTRTRWQIVRYRATRS